GKWDKWSSGAEGSNPTLQKSFEKNLTSRLNLSYNLSSNHKITMNYMVTRFSRDLDDPMLTQQERDLIDTRYLNKSVLSGAFESKLFKDRLKSSIFLKQYIQQVSLKDRIKDSRTGAISEYSFSKNSPITG